MRTLFVVRDHRGDRPGVMRITAEGVSTYYRYREIPCEIGGKGFEVWRFAASEPYYVRVGTPRTCFCDCIGFTARTTCRHILALIAIAKVSPGQIFDLCEEQHEQLASGE